MTLTEFLLARIDEDEEVAREARGIGDGALFPMHVWNDARVPSILVHSARVLAECEAKRRIVEEHRADVGADPCDAHDASLLTVDCDTLRLLALPYVDHPDYDEAWRP